MVLELLQDAQLSFQKKCLGDKQKKWVLSKNGLIITLGPLVKLLEKNFETRKKNEYFAKMALELLQDAQLGFQKKILRQPKQGDYCAKKGN